jgi:iron complex outermembrane receptor protein
MFFVRLARSACSVAAVAMLAAATAAAQPPASSTGQPGTVTGQLRQSGSLKPVAKATIIVEGTSLETSSDADGRFSIAKVPPGQQHLVIAAPGMMPMRVEVVIGTTTPAPLDILLEHQVHYTEVVSVSPNTRDAFESYQPTTVLAGQELSKELEGTLGATLDRQPGVAQRSFGPGPSRPVIRGLDGDRVLILEDGQRIGDLSSQSGDHGVPVNPASSTRIEVVRGPATLLYGANAIGGLVNMINGTIATRPVQGASGRLMVDFGSAASEFGTAADMTWGNGRWALNVGGSGRRNGDVDAPDRTIENTQSRGGFGNVGLAWTTQRAFFGGSYTYDDTKYGIPFVEEGQVELTPRRHAIAVKAGADRLGGFIDGIRANFAARRYKHEELVGGEVGTRFQNDTNEADVRFRHQPAGRLTGTFGGSFLDRAFNSIGEEALSPPIDERAFAGFFYEELTWPHLTFQFGARVNHASFDPREQLPPRDFTDVSGSLGLLVRPAAANDRLTVALSLARAARNPALEELYFFGPHPGNFAFEIGNPDLGSEKALGFDVSLRWRAARISGELTYFRNSIDDYIFRNPITEEEFDERFPHDEDENGEGHGEFPFVEFVAANSVLQGIEGHADLEFGRGFEAELGLDYVRGELRDTNQPLPRIPPFRFRGGMRYHRAAFQAGGEVVAVSKQDRTFGAETPTDGYNLLKLFGSYSIARAGGVHTFTVRLDNATNELYRNHLSFVKDDVPEIGRNFKVVYSVQF